MSSSGNFYKNHQAAGEVRNFSGFFITNSKNCENKTLTVSASWLNIQIREENLLKCTTCGKLWDNSDKKPQISKQICKFLKYKNLAEFTEFQTKLLIVENLWTKNSGFLPLDEHDYSSCFTWNTIEFSNMSYLILIGCLAACEKISRGMIRPSQLFSTS